MKLYINPGSGSACVEALLAELDIRYERVAVEYSEDDGIIDDSFASINPRMQIPALVLEDGVCLTESAAILMYLADLHPDSQFAPAIGSLERARLNQWMCFVLSNIYEGELRKNYPQRYVQGNPDLVQEAACTFVMENYQILENALAETPYFFGNQITILDIYIWMFVNWIEDIEDFRAACPKVTLLAEAVMNRPKIATVHADNFGSGLGWNDNGTAV
jgi:glutathione S-transferase